jgi:hypothetical protein
MLIHLTGSEICWVGRPHCTSITGIQPNFQWSMSIDLVVFCWSSLIEFLRKDHAYYVPAYISHMLLVSNSRWHMSFFCFWNNFIPVLNLNSLWDAEISSSTILGMQQHFSNESCSKHYNEWAFLSLPFAVFHLVGVLFSFFCSKNLFIFDVTISQTTK